MGLKSTWWIEDEREPLCDLCKNDGCNECDPDYEAAQKAFMEGLE